MEVKRDNRNIFEAISIALVMLFLITASFFFYSRVIRENYYGTVGEFLNFLPGVGAKTSTTPNLDKKILLLESKATARFFNKDTGEQLSIMWGNFLKQKKVAFDIISQDEFAGKNISSYDILILPYTLCLSDGDIAKIKDFAISEKKGIILDGYPGARDENGKWRDASLLSEIVGAYSIKEVEQQVKGDETRGLVANIILDGTSVLSANITPGFRLEVNTYNKPVSANIVEPRVEIDGYWEDAPIDYQKKLTSAETGIVHGKYLGARFVWLGFTMGAVTGNIADQKVWQKLLDNIFNYVSFWPIVYKDSWDKGKKTTVIFAQDTEDKFQNSLTTVSLLAQKQVPATFFCVPELAAKYTGVFEKIYSNPAFEVGLHGIQVYQGQTYETQEQRLKEGRETLEKLSGRKVRGFRPPLAIYDKNTLQALTKLDYDYIAGDDIKQMSPEIMLVKKNKGMSFGKNLKTLVRFPKTGNDDYDILERYRMQDKNKMLQLLKQDFDGAYMLGGLYYYSFHTQLMAEEDYIDVIGKLIDYIKEKDVWFTTFGELNDWWGKWALGVDVYSEQVGPNRTTIKITNNSLSTVKGVKVNAILPPFKKLTKTYSEKLGKPVPFFEGKEGKVVFDIERIKSDESIDFDIEYE